MLPETTAAEIEIDPLDASSTLEVPNDVQEAIASFFFEHPRALDVRCLWTRGALSYFRVNWWTEGTTHPPRVRRSAFVVVETCEHGYRIREVTRRDAA